MKVDVKIILLKDAHGNKASVTVEEGCDMVQVCGLYGREIDSIHFEGRAYELHGWASGYDIEIKEIDYSYDFDALWKSV